MSNGLQFQLNDLFAHFLMARFVYIFFVYLYISFFIYLFWILHVIAIQHNFFFLGLLRGQANISLNDIYFLIYYYSSFYFLLFFLFVLLFLPFWLYALNLPFITSVCLLLVPVVPHTQILVIYIYIYIYMLFVIISYSLSLI